MNSRTPLGRNTVLLLGNRTHYKIPYFVDEVIGYGTSCITYAGSYMNSTGQKKRVRIKECYPRQPWIKRGNTRELCVAPGKERLFEAALERFQKAFELSNVLFEKQGMTNAVSNSLELYEAGNTLYTVSAYTEGETLAEHGIRSVEEAIRITVQVAEILEVLHREGYLYLDLKPENLWLLKGNQEWLQLFDFDAMRPKTMASDLDAPLFYTEGFAAVELRRADRRNLDEWTDVYSLGALLYWMLFGKAPDAFACNRTGQYDFTDMLFPMEGYRDRLFFSLSAFFRKTLQSYYADRYASMEEALSELKRAERYAVRGKAFIHDSYIPVQAPLVGRREESAQLEQWARSENPCLFVRGMAGIGKSALVREFIASHGELFDSVVYISYRHSLEETLSDDEDLWLEQTKRLPEETMEDYYVRKLQAVRRLASKESILLILDNYEGGEDASLQNVASVGWKVLVLTRKRLGVADKNVLELGPLQSDLERVQLFEEKLGRSLRDEEVEDVQRIAERLQGHPLGLELLAAQIVSSCLTTEEAGRLVDSVGLAGLAAEKISYRKDGICKEEHIAALISELFGLEKLSGRKRGLLKLLSLFGQLEIQMRQGAELLGLESLDELNALQMEGWISIENSMLHMHPFVAETLGHLGWRGSDQRRACRLLAHLAREKGQSLNKALWRKLSENVLGHCGRDRVLRQTAEFQELCVRLLCELPREREKFIFAETELLLSQEWKLEPEKLMELLDYVHFLYCESGNGKKAEELLQTAKLCARKHSHNYLWGLYYEMLGNYYDSMLGGDYQPIEIGKKYLRQKLISTNRKAIRCMKKVEGEKGREHLTEDLLSAAMLLIRGFSGQRRQLIDLLGEARKNLNQSAQKSMTAEKHRKEGQLRGMYFMVCAWYYALVDTDIKRMKSLIERAEPLLWENLDSRLDYLDNCLIPAANMFQETGKREQAYEKLQRGIALCEKYPGVVPYERKKREISLMLTPKAIPVKKLEK
jgi:serine/threonine protein kinase